MKKTLRPFQVLGASFLVQHPHALLADEMGLGKTIQAIAAAEQVGAKNVLVVCPASVRLNWHQEIVDCLGVYWAEHWEIVSYNQAAALARDPLAGPWDAIIIDEAHFCKTPESQRTRAIFGSGSGLVRRAHYKWCLTGTPILNRPREFYPMLRTLATPFAGLSYPAFTQRYCAAFFDGRGINTKGASHLDELYGKLGGFMLRRTKAEVMPELPPKMISRIPLEVSEQDLREVWAEEELVGNREAKISSIHEDFSQLGDMARLLRLTGEAKVRATVEFLDELLDGGGTEKVVVFARHREVIKRLETGMISKGRGVSVLHGGMSDDQKAKAVSDFQMRNEVFIGQIQAAGTGINGLQNVCSHVVFAELSWVPGETSQALDRLHRIGQSASSVNVYILHVPGTLESAVLGVHDSKTKVIDRLLGEGAPAAPSLCEDFQP